MTSGSHAHLVRTLPIEPSLQHWRTQQQIFEEFTVLFQFCSWENWGSGVLKSLLRDHWQMLQNQIWATLEAAVPRQSLSQAERTLKPLFLSSNQVAAPTQPTQHRHLWLPPSWLICNMDKGLIWDGEQVTEIESGVTTTKWGKRWR